MPTTISLRVHDVAAVEIGQPSPAGSTTCQHLGVYDATGALVLELALFLCPSMVPLPATLARIDPPWIRDALPLPHPPDCPPCPKCGPASVTPTAATPQES